MPRKLITVLTAVVGLNGIGAGSVLLWPDAAGSTGSPAIAARTDFDHVFASVTAAPRRAYIPAFLTMIDFKRAFAGDNALPRREYVPVFLTAIEFERTFGSVADALRSNTPPNREKLRNAGWKRILESS